MRQISIHLFCVCSLKSRYRLSAACLVEYDYHGFKTSNGVVIQNSSPYNNCNGFIT